ncbi:MAG: DUF5717 family protein [Agathobacter sp.]|nr:DUF5717 family protein [Agathobacter sp.]
MRKRIRQIARGKFEYAKPILTFSEEFLDLQITEDKDESGSFTISTNNDEILRGVVYCTEPRMECLTPQFEGAEIRIRYQFHSRGLVEGDKVEGAFIIVCNQSEYSLSFCAIISKRYPTTSIGVIHNLYDFACLAKENWDEAFQLFYHKNFTNVINSNEVKELMIYRGMVSSKPSNQNLEEFLVGIKKKEVVKITTDKTEAVYYDITDSISETCNIRKSGWGYIEINISSDSEFIELPQTRLVTDDFIGSTYPLEYVIDPDRMHAGLNFGKVYIKSAYQMITLTITASCEPQIEEVMESTRTQINECKTGIMELYQAYRLKRIVTGVWSNETVDILNHLHALVPDEPMYVLMKAQAFIINRQRQEAEWILDEFKRECNDTKSPIWGYYLYLMTLMEREPSYVDRMTHEIELIFYDNPDSALLFWVLLFLQEQYFNNNARKLKDIEYWVLNGCNSPYLYIEAFYLIWQDPYLLSKLDKFEIRIIRWAIKHHALTKDIVMQLFQIIDMSKGFDKKIYDILCSAYEVDSKLEYIGSICSYLIKNQQYDAKYHTWFEKGIELELRITGLYEAYLLSLDDREIISIPKIIQMYFRYESSLPYRKMAVLYNNIIAGKDTNPEVYQKYRKTMGKFAMAQVEMRHMDDNLAVIYKEMLDIGLVNEEIAHCLARIIFTNKLVVFDEKMVRAIVYQRQIKNPQIVPIVDQAAYFQLFSKDYVILFEDENGRRYVGSVSYRLQNLMEPEKYIEKCMELAPSEVSYLVNVFQTRQSYLTFNEKDKMFFPYILNNDELSVEFESQMTYQIMRYYESSEEADFIVERLNEIDFSILDKSARQYLMDMLIMNRQYDFAYELISQYGIDQISSASKVSLASHLIEENGEEDESLLGICEQTFISGKYNDRILSYLAEYYNGPTDVMRKVWDVSKEYDIDTFELEERILVQMMYSDAYLPKAEQVFYNYYENGGRELVVLAFLSDCAHKYFVHDAEYEKTVFDIIQSRYEFGLELNDACKLGLLKYLSELSSRSDVQFKIEDELLAEYTCRNMNFAFYKKLDRELILKYHLYDKVFLEYRTSPHSHVVLHYSRDEDGEEFTTEDMFDVYEGIFVKPFVLFFGEMIQYYITEEKDNQVEVTESNRISNNDVYSEKDQSRYNLINQMLISTTLQDEMSLYKNMKQYSGFDEVTRKVFKIL